MRFSTEKTFKSIENSLVYKLPGGAIHKPPCVQLINNLFSAIHQVFAMSSKDKQYLGRIFVGYQGPTGREILIQP